LILIHFNGWIVADAAEFRILRPEVGLNLFCRGQKSQDRLVTWRKETKTLRARVRLAGQQTAGGQCRRACCQSQSFHKGSPSNDASGEFLLVHDTSFTL
jgi:hypothetical protein